VITACITYQAIAGMNGVSAYVLHFDNGALAPVSDTPTGNWNPPPMPRQAEPILLPTQ
jgi:hypothetical protein